MTNLEFMKLTVLEAEKSVIRGEGGPFGALIVIGNRIISSGRNMVIKTGDPTTHAEIMAIRSAVSTLKNEGSKIDLSSAEIYSSCEPCPMCLAAICYAGIKTVYSGCTREDARKIGFDDSYIYDVFCGKAKKLQLDIVEVSDIQGFMNAQYDISLDLSGTDNRAFVIDVKRDGRGRAISSKIVGAGKDEYEITGDPTSISAINAIRNITAKNRNFDMSGYEMVTFNRIDPLTFAAMHWAKLKKVYSGHADEPYRNMGLGRVLSTIRGDGESMIIRKSLGREECLAPFDLWENRLEKTVY